MKQVDLSTWIKGVSQVYRHAEMPMYIYHSTKELDDNEPDAEVIHNIMELNEVMQRENILRDGKPLWKKNIWIATGETIVPDKCTSTGAPVPLLKEDRYPMQTDNCYIRVVYINAYQQRAFVFTSSGVWIASMNVWNFSAGVMPQFIQAHKLVDIRMTGTPEEKVEKIKKQKKNSVMDMEFVSCFLNPYSPTFLDAEKSLKKVAHPWLSSRYHKLYLSTERIQKLIIKHIGLIMPGLKEAFNKSCKPEEIIDLYKKIAVDAAGNERLSVQDKVFAVDALANIAHKGEVTEARLDNDLALPMCPSIANAETGVVGGVLPPTNNGGIQHYDESLEIAASTESSKAEIAKMDQEIEKRKTETETMDEFIIDPQHDNDDVSGTDLVDIMD